MSPAEEGSETLEEGASQTPVEETEEAEFDIEAALEIYGASDEFEVPLVQPIGKLKKIVFRSAGGHAARKRRDARAAAWAAQRLKDPKSLPVKLRPGQRALREDYDVAFRISELAIKPKLSQATCVQIAVQMPSLCDYLLYMIDANGVAYTAKMMMDAEDEAKKGSRETQDTETAS